MIAGVSCFGLYKLNGFLAIYMCFGTLTFVLGIVAAIILPKDQQDEENPKALEESQETAASMKFQESFRVKIPLKKLLCTPAISGLAFAIFLN